MSLNIKKWLLLALMALSALGGYAMRPTHLLADNLPALSLEEAVPVTFGEWHQETAAVATIINPEQKAMLDRVYSQTLSRTYTNAAGYRIMLSIAYGRNQSKEGQSQMHKPEICYPAQGFRVLSTQRSGMQFGSQSVATTQLETQLSKRVEPLTYWSVVGDQVVVTGMDARIVELKYAFENQIPDGMLVRISSIDSQSSNAYALQEDFAHAMVAAIPPTLRVRFTGVHARPFQFASSIGSQ
jgi:EpsI family protein